MHKAEHSYTAWQKENRKEDVCTLGYAPWTVVTLGEENVAQVETACFDSLNCRAYTNVTMHLIKKGN